MAYGTPTDPVAGTVITVAYAIANMLNPIRWLRLLTGNADPPGSSYVVVSTSTTGTQWMKIPSDALAAGVAVANLGYTPVNRAGDTGMTGNFTTTGILAALGLSAGASGIASTGPIATSGGAGITAAGTMTAGTYAGGNTSTGSPSFRGASVGGDGIASSGPIITSGSAGITAGGQVSGASFNGGSLLAGVFNLLGLSVGASGIATTGPVNPASYTGGSTSAGNPSVQGLSVGANGIASGGTIATSGSAGMSAAGGLAGATLTIAGVVASATPAAGRIPMGDAGGKLDAWISASGGAIPSGLIAYFQTAAAIASGWARFTAANGRMIVCAGTVFSTTWTENNGYGSSWAHKHQSNSWAVSVTSVTVAGSAVGGPSDQTGTSSDINGLATAGGVNLNTTGHRHTLSGVSLAVSASGTGSGTATGDTSDASWTIPSYALVAAQKS